MLNRFEQPDASPGGCGAIGTPHSPAGRADLSLDRDHWSFDPAAYRRDHLARIYSPNTISAVLLVLTAFCAVAMVAVALGLA